MRLVDLLLSQRSAGSVSGPLDDRLSMSSNFRPQTPAAPVDLAPMFPSDSTSSSMCSWDQRRLLQLHQHQRQQQQQQQQQLIANNYRTNSPRGASIVHRTQPMGSYRCSETAPNDWITMSLASPDHGSSYSSHHPGQHGTCCSEPQTRALTRHNSTDFQRPMSVGSSGTPSSIGTTGPVRNAVLLASLLQPDTGEPSTPSSTGSDKQWLLAPAQSHSTPVYGQAWGETHVADCNPFRAGNPNQHRARTDDGVASSIWNGFARPNEIRDDGSCFLTAGEHGRVVDVDESISSSSLFNGDHARTRNGRHHKVSSSCSPVESFIDDLDDGSLTPLSPPITSNIILNSFAMKSEPPASPWHSAPPTTPVVHNMNSITDKTSYLGSDGCQSAETSPLATSVDEGPASSSESWWWPLDRASMDFDLADSISANTFIQHNVDTRVADDSYSTGCYHGDESSVAASEAVERYVGMGDSEVECDLSMFNLVGVEVADGDGDTSESVYRNGLLLDRIDAFDVHRNSDLNKATMKSEPFDVKLFDDVRSSDNYWRGMPPVTMVTEPCSAYQQKATLAALSSMVHAAPPRNNATHAMNAREPSGYSNCIRSASPLQRASSINTSQSVVLQLLLANRHNQVKPVPEVKCELTPPGGRGRRSGVQRTTAGTRSVRQSSTDAMTTNPPTRRLRSRSTIVSGGCETTNSPSASSVANNQRSFPVYGKSSAADKLCVKSSLAVPGCAECNNSFMSTRGSSVRQTASGPTSFRNGLLTGSLSSEFEARRNNVLCDVIDSGNWFNSQSHMRSASYCDTERSIGAKTESNIMTSSTNWNYAATSQQQQQQQNQDKNVDEFDMICDFVMDSMDANCSINVQSQQPLLQQLSPTTIDDDKLMSMLVDLPSHQVDYCARDNRPEVIDPFELAAMSFGASDGDNLATIELPVESDDTSCHLDDGNANDDHDYCTRPSRTMKHNTSARSVISDDKSGTMTRVDCDGLPVQPFTSSTSMRCDALRHLLLDVNLPDEVRRQSEIDREASRLKMSAKTSAAEAASEFLSRLLKLTLAREMQERMQPQTVSGVPSLETTAAVEHPRKLPSSGNCNTDLYASMFRNCIGNDVIAATLQSFVKPMNGPNQANTVEKQLVDELGVGLNRILASPVDLCQPGFDGPVEEIGGEETIETTSTTVSGDPNDHQFGVEFVDQIASDQPEACTDLRNNIIVPNLKTTNALIDTYGFHGYRDYDTDDDNNMNNRSPEGSDAATESAPETNDLDDVYDYFDDEKVDGDEVVADSEVIEDSATTELARDVQEDSEDVPVVHRVSAAVAEGDRIKDESLALTTSEDNVQISPIDTDFDLVGHTSRSDERFSSLATGATKLRLIGRSKTWRVPSSSVMSMRPKFRWICRRSMASPKSTVVGRRCLMTRGSS